MTKAGNTTVELVGDRELVLTRSFKAPRELLWAAWTQRNQIEQWWGPRAFKTEVPTMEVKPGGIWHYVMRSEEWGESWGKATYQEVKEPEQLVYVDVFSDAAGNTVETMPESLVTVTFTQQDGQTLLTVDTLFDSREARQKVLEMGMEQGYDEQLDRLDEYLQQIQEA